MFNGYTIGIALIGAGVLCFAASLMLRRVPKQRRPADIRTILRTGASGDYVARPRRDRTDMVPLAPSASSGGPLGDAASALRRAFDPEAGCEAQNREEEPTPARVLVDLPSALAAIVMVGLASGRDEQGASVEPLHFVLV